MPLLVNLRHLARHEVTLGGELPVAELELDLYDEMLAVNHPVTYDLTAELLDDNLLVRGTLAAVLDCECVRCLKPFQRRLVLDEWTGCLALKGEESVPVTDDCVDLTPQIREDICSRFQPIPCVIQPVADWPERIPVPRKTKPNHPNRTRQPGPNWTN